MSAWLRHSCLFAGGRMVSSRPGVPRGRMSPEELASLANAIFECKEHINVHRWKTIQSLLST